MSKIRFAVLDVETTGLDPETCEVCEIAYQVVTLDLKTGLSKMGFTFETMVNPGMPIPPEVSAITHIIDEDVVGAMPASHAGRVLGDRLSMDEIDVIVAHNAAFDRSFVERMLHKNGVALPWICTRRLATHMYPDAPKYSNQTLRYYLKLEGIDRHGPTHRALFDAKVTARLFERMLQDGLLVTATKREAELIQRMDSEDVLDCIIGLSDAPITVRKMPFGKHAGELLQDLPWDYLRWAVQQSFDDTDLVQSLRNEWNRRHEQKK